MLEGFHPRRLFSYLIILAIAVVFVLQFGPGSKGCDVQRSDKALAAATVNGKDIPLDELGRAYEMQLMRIRSRMGGQDLPPDIVKQLVKPEQILEQLVDAELLAQAAERRGIVASDAEVREILYKSPDFQRNGKFDYGRYTDVLRQYLRKTPASYETELRRRLSAGKLLELVQSGAVVSEDEVKARFRKEGNRATLKFVRFLPSMYAEAVKTPTPAELTKYAEKESERIAKEYQSNRAAYRTPEQVRVRRILLKMAADLPEDQKESIRKHAAAIRDEIAHGEDFTESVDEYSQDLESKPKKGDLGFKSRESSGWSPAFTRMAFSTPVGKVSDPFETPEGIELLKVEEKKPAVEQPLEAVKNTIALQLYKRDRAQSDAKAKAEATLAKLKAGKKLSDLFPPAESTMAFATESKPEVVDTGSFSLEEPTLPKLGAAPELQAALREKDAVGPIAQVFPVGDGFALAELTERKKPDDTEYQAQRAQLFDEALQGKRTELQNAFIQSVKKAGTVTTHESAITTLTSNG